MSGACSHLLSASQGLNYAVLCWACTWHHTCIIQRDKSTATA